MSRQERALQASEANTGIAERKTKARSRSYPPPSKFAGSGGNSARSNDDECTEGASGRSGTGKGGAKRRRYLERGLKSKAQVGSRSGGCNKQMGISREYPSDFVTAKGVSGSGRSADCARGGSGSKISKRRTRGLKTGGSNSARSSECQEGVSGASKQKGSAKANKEKSNKASGYPSRDYPAYGYPSIENAQAENSANAGPSAKGSADSSGDLDVADEEDSNSETFTASAVRASVEHTSSSSGKKIGFSIGMLGVVLVSLAALKVAMTRKRKARFAKELYADMSDDEPDDTTFVYPTEDELLGPEFGDDLEFEENQKLAAKRGTDDPKSSAFILEDLQDDGFSVETGNSSASSRHPISFRQVAPTPEFRRKGCC